MSVLDKFLNVMKLNDDPVEEQPEDGFLDDEETEEPEDGTSGSHRLLKPRNEDSPALPFTSRRKSRQTADRGVGEDADEEDYGDQERASTAFRPRSSSKISPIRARKREDTGMEVCIIKPHTVEEAYQITDTLLSGCTVILNLEGLEIETAQRVMDFTSGTCYALNGNLQKISSYIFLVTPEGVEISGDLQEILSGAFDVPFPRRR